MIRYVEAWLFKFHCSKHFKEETPTQLVCVSSYQMGPLKCMWANCWRLQLVACSAGLRSCHGNCDDNMTADLQYSSAVGQCQYLWQSLWCYLAQMEFALQCHLLCESSLLGECFRKHFIKDRTLGYCVYTCMRVLFWKGHLSKKRNRIHIKMLVEKANCEDKGKREDSEQFLQRPEP